MRAVEIYTLTLGLSFLESFSLFHDHGGLKVEGNSFYVQLSGEDREKLRLAVNAAIKTAMLPIIATVQEAIRKEVASDEH